jgi:hypothetical protein
MQLRMKRHSNSSFIEFTVDLSNKHHTLTPDWQTFQRFLIPVLIQAAKQSKMPMYVVKNKLIENIFQISVYFR